MCIGAPCDEALFTCTVFACNNALIILILSIHIPTRSLWALFSYSYLNFDFRGLDLCVLLGHTTPRLLSWRVNVGSKHKYKWHNIPCTDEDPAAEQE